MAKFKSLAKQYCAVVKLNQKHRRAQEIRNQPIRKGLEHINPNHWLNIIIGGGKFEQKYDL